MKLVITGKPNSGKTTMAHILEHEFSGQVAVTPDPADMMKGIQFPDTKTPFGKKCYLKALYHLQYQIEDAMNEKLSNKLLICDHGSIDWLKEWPDTPESFFKSVHSSADAEMARYDWVLEIDGDEPSKTIWAQHPRYILISHNLGFSNRVNLAAEVIREILAGRTPINISMRKGTPDIKSSETKIGVQRHQDKSRSAQRSFRDL